MATVAINNSTNAALLAVRILGSHISRLSQEMEKYSDSLQDQVFGKIDKLQAVGWEAYVSSK